MIEAKPTESEMNAIEPMSFDVVIPAAGKGRRLGGPVPKQYLSLNGLPLLAHTLQRVRQINPRRVILVVSEGDEFWREVPGTEDCQIVYGGVTRAESVLNGLRALETTGTLAAASWVMVHDAARPCLRELDVVRLLSAVLDHEVGGILGTKIVETVKYVIGNKIQKTQDREKLWLAQTPQLFRRELLERALTEGLTLDAAIDATVHEITDESSALEKMGYAPLMVEGSKDNIKVTNSADLDLAAYFLRVQQVEAEQAHGEPTS
jgi:2-C-methyl-D-erythritol 4-phosphate cytidylyltransferase